MTGRGREYAAALFELALEDNCRTEISEGLELLRDVFRETPQYAEFLLSPAIPKEERIRSIHESFQGKIDDHLIAFLSILTEKRHVRDLEECINAYDELYRESMKKSDAVVISAVELTDDQKNRLKETLERKSGHTVTVEYRTDKKLIGGVVVEMDGTRMDGSIRHRLKEIKEVMQQ